jgi:prefoldin subunit 5
MSGETENQPSGLSVDNLHNLLRTSLEEMDRRLVTEIAAVARSLETRLNAIDKATDKFEANLVRVPTDVDKQVGQLRALVEEKFMVSQGVHDSLVREIAALRELHAEKFAAVDQRFGERDVRAEHESRDNKVAVDAAFAAQKEAASEQNKSNTLAISKSEAATAETLNKQADLFKSSTDALSARIEDVKQIVGKLDTRLTTIESRGVAVKESQSQGNWLIGTVLSGIAVFISFAGLIIVLVKLG